MAKKFTTDTVNIPLRLNIDSTNYTQVLQQAENQLQRLSQIKAPTLMDKKTLKDVDNVIQKLKEANAVYAGVGGVKTTGYSKIFEELGTSSKQVFGTLDKANKQLIKSNQDLANSFKMLDVPIVKTETALTKLGRTVVNTIRYQAVNKGMDAIAGSVGETIDYFEKVDKNLNNIRIVSGKTQSEMLGFISTAQSYASALSTTTNNYLEASEFFYQQGLSSGEVLERTNATIQAANISGQGVTQTANQMTAVLNGFNLAASETIPTLDKIAALGAGTATDFEEVAKAMQKVASAAHEAGMGLDETLAMVSTISSVTREAPESVGTSLNAIIGRMNNLTVAEVDNVKSYTSQVQKAFESTNSGLSIFEESGEIKERITIFNELAEKWGVLDSNQQATITSALAGTRQANKLMALLGNWGEYNDYLGMSEDSAGALEEQNSIYSDSLESIQKQTTLLKEELWGELFNPKWLKDFNGVLQETLKFLTGVSSNLGGMSGIITPLIGALRGPLVGSLTPVLTKWSVNKSLSKTADGTGYSEAEQQAQSRLDILTTGENPILKDAPKILSHKERETALSEQQNATYMEQIGILEKIVVLEERRAQILAENRGNPVEQLKELNSLEIKASGDDQVLETALTPAKARRELEEYQKALAKDKFETPQAKSGAVRAAQNRKDLLKSKDFKEFESPLMSMLSSGKVNEDITGPGSNKKLKEGFDFYKKMFSNETSQFYKDLKDIQIKVGEDSQFKITDLFIEDENDPNKHKKIANAILSQDDRAKIEAELVQTLDKAARKQLEGSAKEQSNVDEQISKQAPEGKDAANVMNAFERASKQAKVIEETTKLLFAGAAAWTLYKTASDQTLSTQEKLSTTMSQGGAVFGQLGGVMDTLGGKMSSAGGLLGTFGKGLSALGPYAQVAGMAISILGPIFVEAFQIGISESEKLKNSLETTRKAFDSLTKGVREQRIQLKAVDGLYSSLAKEYQNGALDVTNLTEAQQSQYDQVAEYIQVYAPELIKSYDLEGKAIIDLTQQYKDLEKGKRGYLETSLAFTEFQVYSTQSEGVGDVGSSLIKSYGLAIDQGEKLREQIATLKNDSIKSGKDSTEALGKLETELAEVNFTIQNTNKEWDTMVSKTVLLGNASFGGLGAELQGTLSSLSSFYNFANTSNIGVDNFISQLSVLVNELSASTDEVKQKFIDMGDVVREQILNFTIGTDLSSGGVGDFLSNITEDSFISGGFLDDQVYKTEQDYGAIGGRTPEENYEETYRLLEKEKAIKEEIGRLNTEYYERGSSSFKSVDLLEDITAAQDALRGIQSDLSNTENAYEKAQSAQAELTSLWKDSIREIASSSAEGFNGVVDQFHKMQDELSNGQELGILSDGEIDELQSRIGSLYTTLNGDNTDFYGHWRSLNAETINTIGEDYGIFAGDYKTYNEYMSALDEHRARTKIIYEAMATGEQANMLEKLGAFEKESMISRLVDAGETNKAIVVAFAEGEASQEIISTERKKKSLEQLKTELLARQENADDNVELSAKEAKVLQGHMITLGEVGRSEIESVGGEVAVGSERRTYTESVESVITQIDKRIAELNAQQDDFIATNKEAQDAIKENAPYKEMLDALKAPSFNFQDFTGGFSKVDKKAPTVKPSTGLNNLGSGGAGKDKEKKEKEVADIKFDTDPLKPYNDKIKEITHSLEKLRTERDKLSGKAYIDSLNTEIKLNRELLDVEQAKLKKAKEIGEEERAKLAGLGVQFTPDGLISNYNETLKGLEASTNALSAETKEISKKTAEEIKKTMDEYEKYAINASREAEKAIQKLQAELAKAAREKIEYPIQLILSAHKGDKSLIDFLAEVQKHKKGKINFSVEASSSAKNLVESLQTIQEMFTQTGAASDFLSSIYNDPDLQGNAKAQLEMIEKQKESMQDLAKELLQFADQFREAFANGLSEAATVLETELKKYDNITAQYQRLLELSDILGKKDLGTINEVYGSLEGIYRNNLTQQKELVSMMKNSRDQFGAGTEEWLIANDKYLEAQVKVLEQEKQLAELLGQRYDDTVGAGRKEIEDILFRGMSAEDAQEALNKLNKGRDRYLDTEKEIYELSKLERTINKDISKYTDNPKAQAQLKKFMKEELAHLQNKEKLTQHDLDLSAKQYDVIKARIELERAREGEEMNLMLQRNSDGTFGFMYVKNTEMMEEAEQEYQDAIDALYQYSMKRTKELQQESLDIRTDALSEYDKITQKLKNGTITEQESVEALNKAFEEMNERLRENAQAQAEMQQQAASSKLLQILGVTEGELGALDSVETALGRVFDLLGNAGEADGLGKVMQALGLDSSNYVGSVGEQMQKMFQDLGGDDGAMEQLMNAFNDAGNSTAATILGLLQETGDLSKITEEILESSLNGAGAKFEELLEKISSGAITPEDLFTESLINGLDQVNVTWETLNKVITADLDAFVKEFDISDPSSTLGQVTGSIVAAYEKYNGVLNESYDNLMNSQSELAGITGELNKNINKTVENLRAEIAELTNVTKKYSDLRKEVLQTIGDVTKYIEILDKERRAIEGKNKPSSTAPGASGSGSTSGGGSSSGSSGSGASGSGSSGSGAGVLGVNKRVKIISDAVYASAYDNNKLGVYPDYFNSNRTDLTIDGQANGRFRVLKKGGGHVGWFNPGALQAFHTGGKVGVGVGKDEGMALLKKNETVLTEKQTDVVKNMKDMLDQMAKGMNMSNVASTINNAPQNSNMTIYADFPNVESSDEVKKAFEGLSVYAQQMAKKG